MGSPFMLLPLIGRDPLTHRSYYGRIWLSYTAFTAPFLRSFRGPRRTEVTVCHVVGAENVGG